MMFLGRVYFLLTPLRELHPDSDQRLHREASQSQRMSRRMAFNAVFPVGKDWVPTMRDHPNG